MQSETHDLNSQLYIPHSLRWLSFATRPIAVYEYRAQSSCSVTSLLLQSIRPGHTTKKSRVNPISIGQLTNPAHKSHVIPISHNPVAIITASLPSSTWFLCSLYLSLHIYIIHYTSRLETAFTPTPKPESLLPPLPSPSSQWTPLIAPGVESPFFLRRETTATATLLTTGN